MMEGSVDLRTSPALSDDIIAHLVHMHHMMGAAVQPREYIAFVNLYCKIFNDKRKQVGRGWEGGTKRVVDGSMCGWVKPPWTSTTWVLTSALSPSTPTAGV